ncbi:hypothetical protein [Enterobacter sp. CGMCC 5087]|uniref:hypothetical protein n=1 Tax=Enterobacter sp. CGMCC 5087 TaxID=2183878 RepID=UPI00215B215D|nr:hypothetical protein [Enterobacter sp. CGMCC 5087]
MKLRNKYPLLISLISIFVINVSSGGDVAAGELPKGKDYPVKHVYRGRVAPHVDRKDDFTNTYRTRFKEALQNPVTFAGEYSQAVWGCGGSGCHVTALINKRTGKALSRSFLVYYEGDDSPIGEDVLYMNKYSRLLVTYEVDEETHKRFYNYYLLNNDVLDLIDKVSDNRPVNTPE